MLKKRQLPFLSNERALHVFGYLADFAEFYQRLCENDRRVYRDLARAVMLCLADEEWCREHNMDSTFEEVIAQSVRSQIRTEQKPDLCRWLGMKPRVLPQCKLDAEHQTGGGQQKQMRAARNA